MNSKMSIQDLKGICEYVLGRELTEADSNLFIEMLTDCVNYHIMRENLEGFTMKHPDLTSFLLSIKECYK